MTPDIADIIAGELKVSRGTAYDMMREALAEQQEPVAWQAMVEDEALKEFPIKDMAHDWCVQQKLAGSAYSYWIRPLYTTPPSPQPVPVKTYHDGKPWPVAPKPWVGLSEEEVYEAAHYCVKSGQSVNETIRAIESKLKEKNHG
jgi:hypothetical protein